MDYGNLSNLVNYIDDSYYNKIEKNIEYNNLSQMFNCVRVSLLNVNKYNDTIRREKEFGAPSSVIRSLKRKRNNVINEGIAYMKKINKYANDKKINNIFPGHSTILSFNKRIWFLEESNEYMEAIKKDVIENSQVRANPDITAPENDKKYLLRRIIGYQIQEKELDTPTEDLSKTSNKIENKIEKKTRRKHW